MDRSRYQIVRTHAELDQWVGRIRDTGHVALDIVTATIDPMQAELCGIALALGPNDACYIPLTHKQSGDGAGLFAAGLAPDQMATRDVLDALQPVLESAGLLKIGFDTKFAMVLLAQHGIALRNIEDAQLISYALDAGRGSHEREQLSEGWLGHAAFAYGDLVGSGKGKLTFDQVAIDKAGEYAAEGRNFREAPVCDQCTRAEAGDRDECGRSESRRGRRSGRTGRQVLGIRFRLAEFGAGRAGCAN